MAIVHTRARPGRHGGFIGSARAVIPPNAKPVVRGPFHRIGQDLMGSYDQAVPVDSVLWGDVFAQRMSVAWSIRVVDFDEFVVSAL